MNNYIGIIIPKSTYDSMPDLRGNVLSMFSIWEKTARKHGLTLCYIRFFDIQPNKKTVMAFVKEDTNYRLKQIPSPSVIYSRVLDHLPAYRAHIQSLTQSGMSVFNIPNYDVEKYTVHKILNKDSYIRKHLPDTELFTINNLNKLAARYDQLILKKSYGEFGEGTMKLERLPDGWVLSYKTKGDKELKKITFQKTLPAILQKRIHEHTYLIQKLIPLATFHGRPFDMRVAVQRNLKGNFQVSGIMCKVAQDNDFLTNGAQGGTTYPLQSIAHVTHPNIPYQTLVKTITDFSLYVANYLAQHFPHLADLGFDLGITRDGTPYFIECNFISDYVSGLFKEGKLINPEWESVFSTPIDYAKFLITQKKSLIE
ncbi:YheC/YheD family endospore coat-associated protein [Robertmurraya sp. GLU-23]